jgi:hypothetical protein
MAFKVENKIHKIRMAIGLNNNNKAVSSLFSGDLYNEQIYDEKQTQLNKIL